MKITVAEKVEQEINPHPLIGAEVVFTRHSEKNRKHIGAKHWLTLGKVYTVVNYSDYPEIGDGPRIICDNEVAGDVPMNELDYDIISRPDNKPIAPAFSPVTIVLENQDEVNWLRDILAKKTTHFDVYSKLNGLCGR